MCQAMFLRTICIAGIHLNGHIGRAKPDLEEGHCLLDRQPHRQVAARL